MFRALLCPSSGALDYMCVTTAYGVQCLVAGCRSSGAEQQAVRPVSGMLHDSESCNITLTGRIACCPAGPPTTSNQAIRTIGGNNTHIVSSSWWWAQKCPKHVEQIISAINHSVASSWFFFTTYLPNFFINKQYITTSGWKSYPWEIYSWMG